MGPRLSGYEISQLSEQRAQTGFESPPALNRSAEQGLAHLDGARGVNRPAGLVEAETAIVPPQTAVIDQTPGLPFEIVNDVFIDDLEHGIGREYRAPVIHQFGVAAIIAAQLAQVVAEMLA